MNSACRWHLSAPSSTTSGSAGRTRLLCLHNIRDLLVDAKELGGAAVEADALALVELALAVVGGDALGLADCVQAVFICELANLSVKNEVAIL